MIENFYKYSAKYDTFCKLCRKNVNKNFKKELILDTISVYKKFFDKKNKSKLKNISSGIDHSNLAFLIGFPRSGTTLLDTILRSHDGIEVIEEKPILDKFIDTLKIEINNDFSKLEKMDEKFFNKMRKTYFEERNKYVKFDKNKIYIDKLPLNIIFI